MIMASPQTSWLHSSPSKQQQTSALAPPLSSIAREAAIQQTTARHLVEENEGRELSALSPMLPLLTVSELLVLRLSFVNALF